MGFLLQQVSVRKISTDNNFPAIGNFSTGENSPKNVRALLFDMDNTLFDLVEAQMAACEAVSRSLGIPRGNPIYPYFLRPVHGYESHENIRDFLFDYGIPVSEFFDDARRMYEQEKLRAITPYPGVAETLSRIRDLGLPMGIITDAHSRDAVRRLEKAGLISFFSCMVTWDLVKMKKPAPEPFILALEMLKSDVGEVLLIGDSPRRDIEPARALGIRTVYARYGDRFSDDRSPVQADYILNTMAELPAIVQRLSG
jgi:putative hydrolase of the HAD superfamily